jgi:hypothetical protein
MPVRVHRRGPIHANARWTASLCVEPSNWTSIAWEALMEYSVVLSRAARAPSATPALLNSLTQTTQFLGLAGECVYQHWQIFEVFPIRRGQVIQDPHTNGSPWVNGCVPAPIQCCQVHSVVSGWVQVVAATIDGHAVTEDDVPQGSEATLALGRFEESSSGGTDVEYGANDGLVQGGRDEANSEFQSRWDIAAIPGEQPTHYDYDAAVSHCGRTQGLRCLGRRANDPISLVSVPTLPFGTGGPGAVAANALGPSGRFRSHLEEFILVRPESLASTSSRGPVDPPANESDQTPLLPVV